MVNDYVALDLETTGLNPKQDRIIEVGAVKVVDGKVEGVFESLINPGRLLDENISELTGITDDMLKDAPEADEVIPKLLEFMGNDIMVGHKVLFDYSFIKRYAVNRRITFEREGIDTLKLARKFLPELESRKLGDLCRVFDIKHTAHRALGDAQAAAQLYQDLAGRFYKSCQGSSEDAFCPQPLVYRVKKESPVTKPQKERLYKLLDKHKIVIDYDIEKLTKNEASRITDQILSKHGR